MFYWKMAVVLSRSGYNAYNQRQWIQKSKVKSQKCFIAIQEKVYIDQNNKTEAHSGLFVPLIWEYHCIILTSFWFNRLVGCKDPADTWHDEVITGFKLHDIFLTQQWDDNTVPHAWWEILCATVSWHE